MSPITASAEQENTHPSRIYRRTSKAATDRVPSMLLEREEQLNALTELVDRTRSDGGKVVLIRGEAGIGKSALVRRFASDQADRAHVLVGYCDDLSTPHPLGPFWDLASESKEIAPPLQDDDRLGVLRATVDLLSRGLRPTVIVLEDTQWADDATIDAIRYIGRRIHATNGLLILTFRDTHVSELHPLRGVIGELSPFNVVRVQLGTLSPESLDTLISNAGGGLDPEEIFAMTNGNPLYATELMASSKAGLPVSIRDSVLARASKLSSGARRLLDLVSVIPGESDRAKVLRLTTTSEDELAECVTQGLLEIEGDVLFFRHELTRRAVESALTEDHRHRLNQTVLRGLLPDGAAARIMHHAREAGDIEALIQSAPKAARAAAAVGGYQDAAAAFRAVEPYLERVDVEERRSIYDEWARIETYINDDANEILDIIRSAIALHRQVGDDFALARSLTAAAEFCEEAGWHAESGECLDEALSVLDRHAPSAELAAALGRKAFVTLRRGDHASGEQIADRSLALAADLDDKRAALNGLNAKGFVRYAADTDDRDLLEEARRRAVHLGDDFEEARALFNAGFACLVRRDFKTGIDFLERSREVAIRANMPAIERIAVEGLAKSLFFSGEWEHAEELAVQDLSKPYSNLATPTATHILARLAIRRGEPGAADRLEEAWADKKSRMSPARGHLMCARAELMWISGRVDPDIAASLLRAETEEANMFWDGEVSLWLWLAGFSPDDTRDVPEPYGLMLRGAPQEAVDQWEQSGMPYEKAVAMVLCKGSMALDGLELLETLGAHATAGRCRQMLRNSGMHVPRGRGKATRDHPAGLTARQDEVLQLLAEDLTDGEIADRLFVSTRTVNHHVSAVLGKLGVATRAEATDRATALGLLS